MTENEKVFDGVAVHFSNSLNNRPDEFEIHEYKTGLQVVHIKSGLRVILTERAELESLQFKKVNLLQQVDAEVAKELHTATCNWLGAEFVTAMANNDNIAVSHATDADRAAMSLAQLAAKQAEYERARNAYPDQFHHTLTTTTSNPQLIDSLSNNSSSTILGLAGAATTGRSG